MTLLKQHRKLGSVSFSNTAVLFILTILQNQKDSYPLLFFNLCSFLPSVLGDCPLLTLNHSKPHRVKAGALRMLVHLSPRPAVPLHRLCSNSAAQESVPPHCSNSQILTQRHQRTLAVSDHMHCTLVISVTSTSCKTWFLILL